MLIDIIIIFLIFSTIIFLFYKLKLYNSEKHKSAIQLLIGLNVIFTVYVLFKSIQIHSEDIANNDSIFFDRLMNGLLDSPITIFVKYPKMNYFYDEIYNGTGIGTDIGTDRDEYLEQIITHEILNKCSQFIEYYYGHIDFSEYSEKVKLYNVKVIKIMNQHLKSNAFKKYTVNYLNDLAGPLSIKWFKEFYNIEPSNMENTISAQAQGFGDL